MSGEARALTLHDLELALRDFPGPADERVEAVTPDSAHRFEVESVEWDDDRRSIVLWLVPCESEDEDDRCGRCRVAPVADDASGLCWHCSEGNDGRVVL